MSRKQLRRFTFDYGASFIHNSPRSVRSRCDNKARSGEKKVDKMYLKIKKADVFDGIGPAHYVRTYGILLLNISS